jgi:hypothetical protein
VDRFTKRITLEATMIKATSEDITIILWDWLFWDHGLPRKIIHDHDIRFIGKFMTTLCKLLGIKQNLSTAYHPQTDGQTEWANQQIEEYLQIFVNYHQDD